MDAEMLARADSEADGLIESWSSGPFSEGIDIGNCTNMMGRRFSEVYGAAISLELLAGYGQIAGQWIMEQAAGMVFGYAVSKIGGALKQVYHNHATGKPAPKPKEFKTYVLHAKSGSYTFAGGEATLTATRKDGSVDSM